MEDFALQHPWMTFGIVVIALFVVADIVNTPFRMWSWWLRSQNIRAAGWPPEHLDADGDFRTVEED